MKWATRKGVKLDRTACAWVIRRFIDPDAEFLFLSGEDMPAAIAAGANAFHNYAWTGSVDTLPPDRVTFTSLVATHHLADDDPAMALLARAVPQGERAARAGDDRDLYSIWGIVSGLSALHPDDDQAIVDAMLPVYDALYAYCRRRAAGQPAKNPGD